MSKENITAEEIMETKEVVNETVSEEVEKEEGKVINITPEDFKNTVNEQIEMFRRRTVNLTSKRKTKKTFSSEKIIGDEYDEIIEDGARRELEYKLLSDSAKAGKPKILKGRVFGIEEVTVGTEKTYKVLVNFIPDPKVKRSEEKSSEYQIEIPAPHFFFYDEEKYKGPLGYELLKKELRDRNNALIDFIVYDITADNTSVIASRVAAMQLRSYEYYLGPRKQIEVGSVCIANVVRVGRHGLTAEVLGANCYISNDELDWNHITAANDVFDVGDKIKVRIKEIQTVQTIIYGTKYIHVNVVASRKDAMENPAIKYFDVFNIGQTVTGIVTMRLHTGEYFVKIGNRMTCKCKPPSFGTPELGQECSVYIKDKNRENHTITGAITYLGKLQ